MTNNEFIQYYINLLILQYHQLPKARGHIEALIKLVSVFELLNDVQNGFDIDTAVGVQLDTIGEFPIGLPRKAFIASDTDYRFYLKFKIILNSSNASVKEIDDLLYDFFSTNVKLTDNQDMSLSYNFTLPPFTFEQMKFLRDNGLIPKPAGVGYEYLSGSSGNPFVFENDPDGKGYSYLMAETLDIDAGSGSEKLNIDAGLGDGVEEQFMFNYPGDTGILYIDTGSGEEELLIDEPLVTTYLEVWPSIIFGYQVDDGGEYSHLI